VNRNELYGYLHPATREWREGLISVTFRDMANSKTHKHQWILLDGDIDAEWIEVAVLVVGVLPAAHHLHAPENSTLVVRRA
jgi:dynein heavy chain